MMLRGEPLGQGAKYPDPGAGAIDTRVPIITPDSEYRPVASLVTCMNPGKVRTRRVTFGSGRGPLAVCSSAVPDIVIDDPGGAGDGGAGVDGAAGGSLCWVSQAISANRSAIRAARLIERVFTFHFQSERAPALTSIDLYNVPAS